MNNQQAIDRLVEHLECGWSEETVEAIGMGIHALKETQWIPCSEKMPEEDRLITVKAGRVRDLESIVVENNFRFAWGGVK